MKNTKVLLIGLLGLLVTMTMCKKDDDGDPAPPYVGSWETEPFEMIIMSVPQTVKMDFEFAAENFVAEMKIVAGAVEVGVLGVKGDVTDLGNQVLDVSLTDIGQFGDTGYDYKNRVDDSLAFEGLYAATLEGNIPKDFEAKYVVEGDQLDLIIPAAQDTIVFYRK